MFGRDTWACVGHRQAHLAGQQLFPKHADRSTSGRVANGVVDQVGRRAAQLAARAGQGKGWGRVELQALRFAFGVQQFGKTARFGLTFDHQRGQVDQFMSIWQRAAFQAREHQQVVDQRLHAFGLRGHQSEVMRALGVRQGQGLHRLDEAREHRQRRSDLVRHVGHEVAAHGFGLRQRGDVLRQQQLVVVGVGMNLHRQLDRTGR